MEVTRSYARLLTVLFLVLVSSGSALALNTHLNITIEETVHQNVTFAEDFTLVENRTYSLIEGVVTVINPGAETVYDVHIRLNNIENLASDFLWTGANRPGYQVIYPNVTGGNDTITGNITSTWRDLGIDYDEDGTTDSVRVNATHLLFNLTSEYELHAFRLRNHSTDVDISSVPTDINMNFTATSVREDGEYNDGVTFLNGSLSGTVVTANALNATDEVTLLITNTARNYAILHIPELRTGQQTIFNYNISSLLVDPPLDVDTQYTNSEFETKVLSGERFGVRLTASNIATVGQLENVNITLQAADVNVSNSTSSEIFNFTLHNLSNATADDDFANVDNTSNRTWYWSVNAGTIPIGESHNISFQIRAPDTVSSSGTHLALTQTLQYRISTTASTLNVGNVRARGSVEFNTTKQIISPQDNLSNNNVTWQSEPKVGTNENVTYTLEKVTLWVTTTLDPNEETSITSEYVPSQSINLTDSWTGSAWLFNFTDGSSVGNPPPIVWVKPYWIIRNTGNQIVNSSVTVNGTDLYMNYIYVVNGYWLEVQKQVLDSGDDTFDIRVVVRNRGNGYTPQNMTVTVYDFISSDFSAYNFTPTYNTASNVTGEFGGIAYQWDVGLRTNLSTSFAPAGDATRMDYFYLNYSVNGTGDFQVSDLYIVGLDPRLVDGASAYEGVSVLSSIASTSREMLYLAVVLFLIAINIANFMMTRRIHDRLR